MNLNKKSHQTKKIKRTSLHQSQRFKPHILHIIRFNTHLIRILRLNLCRIPDCNHHLILDRNNHLTTHLILSCCIHLNLVQYTQEL